MTRLTFRVQVISLINDYLLITITYERIICIPGRWI